MEEESKDSESPGQKNIKDIFKKLEQEQGVVTNNVEDLNDLFENFNQDKFFPRIDDLSDDDKIKKANEYVDEVLKEFVDDYAIKLSGSHATIKNEKTQKITKIYETKPDDSYWPYFIQTCSNNQCYKELNKANKKFKVDYTLDESKFSLNNIDVIKYGYYNLTDKRKIPMSFSYKDDRMKIEWTTKEKKEKNIQTKSIEVDDIINNKLMIMNEKDSSIKLNQKKWYNDNINVDRNILICFQSSDSYKRFETFMKNIKKKIVDQNKGKVIAADVIRSTMISTRFQFFADIQLFFKFISKMNDGMIGKINNTFHKNKVESLMRTNYNIPYYYYGLNVTFFIKYTKEDDLKDKYIAFEVQFHTESTYDVKERLHDDYDIQKGFDYLSLSTDKFKEKFITHDNDSKFSVLKNLNEKYNEIMDNYYESNHDKKQLINKIVENREKISKEHLHDLLLKKSPIIKLFKTNLKKKNILNDMEFIELVTDKHNFVYKLSEQISLMKELFILCRCIKNNKLINEKNIVNSAGNFNNEDISHLVRVLNCEKYYGFKSDFLENKYKNPNCNFDKHKKLKDFLGTTNTRGTTIPVIEKLTNESFLDALNKELLKYLCDFIGCPPYEEPTRSFIPFFGNKLNEIDENKKRLVSMFKKVMKYDIGIPPFA